MSLRWRTPQRSLVGIGEADRFTVPGDDPAGSAAAVTERLACRAAETGVDPASVIGWVRAPFSTAEPIEVVVAERVVDAQPADEDGDDHLSGPIEVTSALEVTEWMDRVASATRQIRDGRATKVVLAREITVTRPGGWQPTAVADRLAELFPSCATFVIDGFVGATPELLVGRSGATVRSHPLAGTAPRSADPDTDAALADRLLGSAKDRAEHQITIDRVHETLLPFCSYLDSEPEPSIVAVANVVHLGTWVEGRLSEPAPPALELAMRLHPTPAVCGEPRAVANEMISELEGFDRGPYAGFVGWVDGTGDGELMVAIRSAIIEGDVARCWAGVGIVADSDPEAELAETRAKLRAVLGALVRP